MSNFISNSFQLPNDLIDKGYMAKMKGAALPCYLFIVRKTRGWNKSEDGISISQFVEGTGYNKDSVQKSLNQLVTMGIVKKLSDKTKTVIYTLTDSIIISSNSSENIDQNDQNNAENLDKNYTNNSHNYTEKSHSENSAMRKNSIKLCENLVENYTKNSQYNNNIKTNKTNIDLSSDSKSEKPKSSIEKFSFVTELKNLGADQQLIQDWMIVRKAKQAKDTQTAFDGFVREYKKSGLDVNTVLRICIEKNWKGFNASWDWQEAVSSLQTPDYPTPEQHSQSNTYRPISPTELNSL